MDGSEVLQNPQLQAIHQLRNQEVNAELAVIATSSPDPPSNAIPNLKRTRSVASAVQNGINRKSLLASLVATSNPSARKRLPNATDHLAFLVAKNATRRRNRRILGQASALGQILKGEEARNDQMYKSDLRFMCL